MDSLTILWTTDIKDVFLKMIGMYALNSKKQEWWENVTLIIWGPSARLLAEDTKIQAELIELIYVGVKIEACKACADSYGVSDKLSKMGVEVKYMGKSLTEYIKNGSQVLAF